MNDFGKSKSAGNGFDKAPKKPKKPRDSQISPVPRRSLAPWRSIVSRPH
jgi:hypothetical protein